MHQLKKRDQLATADQALALSRLEEDETERVLETLRADDAAEVISHLTETQAAQTIGSLEAATAAAIVHEMSVAEVIGQLSDQQERFDDDDIRYGYVCDDRGRLVGVLPMGNLLFVKRSQKVADLMIREPLSVVDTAKLDDLVEFFDTHHFLGVPVLDSDGVLKGVVHRAAVDYAAARAMEIGYLKSHGIVGGEELRTMSLGIRSRRRLSWLSINILLNVGAASVIALFQDTLQQVIALAVFLPIISDMSGCSGNQAVAVSMRELSLGLVRPTEMLRVWLKEVTVGLINGAVLGLLVGVVAVLFDGNPYLGVVVAVALFVNTVIAVSIGGTVPLLLKRLGFDPAVASGPLLTTVTDMCGFFLVLGIATLMLPRLVQI